MGMGAGGSPCRSGRISGDSPPDQVCRGYRLRPRAGRRGDNAPKRHFFGIRLGARRRALAHTAQKTRAVVRPTLKPP